MQSANESLRYYLGDDRLLDADGWIVPVGLFRSVGRRVWWQVWPWYLLAAAMYLYLLRRGSDPVLTLLLSGGLYVAILVGYQRLRTPPTRGHLMDVAASTELCAQIGSSTKLQSGAMGAVDDAIGTSTPVRGADGSFIHYSQSNNVSVVLNADGSVRTVSYGQFKLR